MLCLCCGKQTTYMLGGCSTNRNKQNSSTYYKCGKCLHKRNRSIKNRLRQNRRCRWKYWTSTGLTFTRRRRRRRSCGGVSSRNVVVRLTRFVRRRLLPSDCRRLPDRRWRSSGVFGRRRRLSGVFGRRPRLFDRPERLPRRRRRRRPSLRFLWQTGPRRLPPGFRPVFGLLRRGRRWVSRDLYVHKNNADWWKQRTSGSRIPDT